jgi:hypothetical protein
MLEKDVQAKGGLWLCKPDFIVKKNDGQKNKVLSVVRFQKATPECEPIDSHEIRQSK